MRTPWLCPEHYFLKSVYEYVVLGCETLFTTHGSVCLAHVETEYCPVRFSDMLELADRRRSPYVSGVDRDVGTIHA